MPQSQSFLESHWIICASIVVSVGYMITGICKKQLERDSLVNVLAVFIATASVISGLKLSFHTLVTHNIADSLNIEDSEVAFTIIGGISVAWMAVWELIKKFKDLFLN